MALAGLAKKPVWRDIKVTIPSGFHLQQIHGTVEVVPQQTGVSVVLTELSAHPVHRETSDQRADSCNRPTESHRLPNHPVDLYVPFHHTPDQRK